MIGKKIGLVTITKRATYAHRGAPIWYGVCECGRARWFRTSALRASPPKTHRFCARGVEEQLELVFDAEKSE